MREALIEVRHDESGRRVVRVCSEDHDWYSWDILGDDRGHGGYLRRECSTCGIVIFHERTQHPTRHEWGVGERIMEPA